MTLDAAVIASLCAWLEFDSEGTFLGTIGSFGQGEGQFFDGPYGLAVDEAGNVYVAEGSETVQKFDSSGKVLAW